LLNDDTASDVAKVSFFYSEVAELLDENLGFSKAVK
jgi:hypothetical protein